ncbi:cache domain-containing sensor histidine kinase [Murimonas intestini]|uniref:Two-component system sensor histidine kinase YesM n=1 Tax=Murimonas intestini TaxID=1337051 RepID=A0AB73SZ58_9FIRM|nr:histidine kinase [Murimonas intestini]MCR1842898.1 sensor histidine kinase [Murimonas intestini]MCR1868138.1 sensor histidine kinase [Murimonas intestini]MCR1885370.1 sensor histidine kinase [Murimonas intestini]
MRRGLHLNSMVVRILCTVALGVLSAAAIISAIVIHISTDIFVDTYGKSQEQVFRQIENDLNDFHENLMKIVNAVDSSWAFHLYLEDGEQEPALSFQTVYQMDSDLEKAIPSNINDISVMVIGMNQKSYINRAETITTPKGEILAGEAAVKALDNPDSIQYYMAENGYTSTTKESRVLMAVKALCFLESKEPYGLVFITIKEEDFEKFYKFFTSDAAEFYLIDSSGEVISSNDKEVIGRREEKDYLAEAAEAGVLRYQTKEDGRLLTVLNTDMPYFACRAYGVIDNGKALDKLYNAPQILLICAVIGAAVMVITLLVVRQTTRPLSVMVRKMSGAIDKDLKEHMDITGSEEVQELARTYNRMLDDLNSYITKLMEIQKEKRKAEISALQMQINPHYIYNTLASIKWLIYEGDTEKSTRTIDAFIMLLRNTISNSDEFITVGQEIENLKNYVLINNTRYGDRIKAEYFVAPGCQNCMILKLILQPFVENAFFHGFPSEMPGHIQVFAERDGSNLRIQIVDDGVGMDQGRLNDLKGKRTKTEHFTGIGVNNVDDRLKLVYGAEYGISIDSTINEGTTVTIIFPAEEFKA